MTGQNKTLAAIDNGSSKIRFDANWYCNSIVIDNATNHWYYLENTQRYIPPQQLGMVVSVTPSARTIVISPVNPPSGGIANGTAGGTISAQFFEGDLAETSGIDYSLVKAIADLNTLITTLNTNVVTLNTSINALRSGWGSGTTLLQNAASFIATGADQTLIAANASKATTLIAVSLAWDLGSFIYPRGFLLGQLKINGTVKGTVTLSGECPTQPFLLPPGGLTTAINQSLDIRLTSYFDSSSQPAWATYWYFQA